MTSRRTSGKRLIAGAALLVLAACDPPGNAPTGLLRPDDPQVTARGKAVYEARCASCHGAHLEGAADWRQRDAAGRLPPPPHDASGHTWHHSDDVLFRVTKYGVSKAVNLKGYESGMPAFEHVLTDADIVAVLSWIKSQWPADIRQRQDEVNRAADRNR